MAPGKVDQGALTFVVHSLTVQSNDDVTNRCEKSIGPTAMWQLIPVTGPWWPSKTSPMPALLQETTQDKSFSDLHKSGTAFKETKRNKTGLSLHDYFSII